MVCIVARVELELMGPTTPRMLESNHIEISDTCPFDLVRLIIKIG
jgi:hypothetical protein